MRSLLFLVPSVLFGCDQLPCATTTDCPVGFFCGSSGSCDFDCLEASDCPQPNTAARRAVCSNEGRCRELARAPRIVVSTPAPGEQLASGLSILTVVGSVETAAPSVAVEVGVVGGGGCSTRAADLELVNPEPGRTVAIPFVQDLLLPPQVERIRLEAEVPGARRSLDVRLRADCEDCPQARIERPENDLTLSALRLPVLSGIVDPGAGGGVWRITDGRLQVMDGPLELLGDRFEIRDLPLFQGRNTVEASFDGGRTRCSVSVSAPLLQEELQVVLTWDGEADLDLVLADEDGRLFERTALSSPRTPDQGPGRVEDDFDGFGPELGFASTGPSQLMGIAVESLTGAPASAFVRVLHRRTMLSIPGLGPRRLRSELGDVWLVALLRFDAEGDAELVPIDRVVGPMEIQSLDGPQSW